MDEMWSFVQSKGQQRWLWHALDHQTGDVLAYVLAPHEDQALEALMDLLNPKGSQEFYTDAWGAYLRLLDRNNTQSVKPTHSELSASI